MSQMMMQAAVTMGQLQNKLDVIGNNLANSQTNGFKGRQADFSSLLYREIDNMKDRQNNAVGRLTPDQIRTGTGAALGAISVDTRQGSIKETGRALDVALTGKHDMFQVQVSENGRNEIQYTRDGSFYLSPEGDEMALVTKDGHPVLGADGPIRIRAGYENIEINDSGEIMVTRNGQKAAESQLQIAEAVRPRSLEAAGDNLFRVPDGADAAGIINPVQMRDGILQSGALEQSNVDISKEMTDMMAAQRSYQFNARTLTMGNEMQGLVNQLR